jgi:hypothetical protein
MVRELHMEHHSLNFPLKNYISKKYFNTSLCVFLASGYEMEYCNA